jgi:hypothetical protein
MIWRDKDFQNSTPKGKLVFLNLLTNSYIGESGLYKITAKTIKDETGVDITTIEKLLAGGLKNVFYDNGTGTVFVAKAYLYNRGGRPDLVVKSIRTERELTPSPLWGVFDQFYELTDNSIIIKYDLNSLPIDTQGINTTTTTSTYTTTSTTKEVKEANAVPEIDFDGLLADWNEHGPGPKHEKASDKVKELLTNLTTVGDASGFVWDKEKLVLAYKYYKAAVETTGFYKWPTWLDVLSRTFNQRNGPGLGRFIPKEGYEPWQGIPEAVADNQARRKRARDRGNL